MKNKTQREKINFECNKNRDFSLKKIKLIIQAAYQTVNTMNLFDLEWSHSKNSFNSSKEKEKILFTNEWNQQILSSILQEIRNITMQNEKRESNSNEKKELKSSVASKDKQFESYDEWRNVIYFNCDQKKHDANECSKSRQMRKTESSLITIQIILSQRDKHDNLIDCVLFDQIVIATTRSEEIRKKEATTQVKKKRIILKRNERINEEHDKYLKSQDQEQEVKFMFQNNTKSKQTTNIKKNVENESIRRISRFRRRRRSRRIDDEVSRWKISSSRQKD
jgi:hypothetical protein